MYLLRSKPVSTASIHQTRAQHHLSRNRPSSLQRLSFLGSNRTVRLELLCFVCVFFPFILDVKSVGRTGRGHTGFLVRLPSAVHAFIFLARRIQPFLFLVDREVEICVLTIFNRSPLVGHLFIFYFYFLVRKNPSYRDSN